MVYTIGVQFPAGSVKEFFFFFMAFRPALKPSQPPLRCVCVCMYLCMCVCTYVRTYSYQPEGWLDPHTVLAPDAHTHTPIHTKAYTHKYTYSTPHTTTVRRTKPGVKWGRVASSFPLRTAHNQVTMKCITWLK
jgi:hypothetical protein